MMPTALRWLLAGASLLATAHAASAAPVPDELLAPLRAGLPVGVIVEFDAAAIDREAATRRARLPRGADDPAALETLAARYQSLKRSVMQPLQRPDITAARDYSHLPIAFRQLRSEAALRALASQAGVRAVHPDRLYQHTLAQSLPLVSAPTVGTAGLRGAGSTVAVIDDGIDLAQSAFGGCTAVGMPASCRIAAVQTFAASPLAGSAHGTNVAAVVVGVAPDARVAALDVFGATGAQTSDILAAINWAIANRNGLNIVAINMSLGDTSHHTAACADPGTNPFATPIANARNAGISVVVAAGNNAYNAGVYSLGLSRPACTPGAVSVGAVYDSSLGGLSWFSGQTAQCTDASTATDQVTCFSNSASYLSLLAPGAVISAGGFAFGGTSQAAPHVAGALATLRAGFPAETLAAIETRLSASGTPVTDPRSGLTTRRLNLLAAARPVNDNFTGAIGLSTASGSTGGSNRLATHEATEPQAAPGSNQSVWWRWTAPASGQLSLDTAGSGFDTRLDVYTGSTLAALAQVSGNDNATPQTASSALRFQAEAGRSYQWAVDGSNGGAGDVALQWSLNAGAQANLSVTLTGPASALPGSTVVYTLTLANAGPQSATGVVATVALPSGLSVASLPAACSAVAGSIGCAAGELASGASVSHLLSVNVGSLVAPVSLSASLVSDLPDPLVANNSASTTLAAGGDEGSVPTLPEWAVIVLAALLLWRGVRPSGELSAAGGIG